MRLRRGRSVPDGMKGVGQYVLLVKNCRIIRAAPATTGALSDVPLPSLVSQVG